MKWCPHCKKYVKTRMNELKFLTKRIRVHHCMDCTGFIETEYNDIDDNKGKIKKHSKKAAKP